MEDAGARNTGIFSDYGVVATTSDNAPDLTRMLLKSLAAERPDIIVFELGDGLLGAYGVEAILTDASIRDALSSTAFRSPSASRRFSGCTRSSQCAPINSASS